MQHLLKFLNDNHWYIIACVLACSFVFWIYGCESQVTSLLYPEKKINRMELENETTYIIGQAKVKLADLDRQDELKQLVLDQAAIFSQQGSFNPMGLLNTIVTIGAVSFGLNRNQLLRDANKTKNTATS